MAKVTVRFQAEFEQEIDWPEDEMENFNRANLICNCDPEEAELVSPYFQITKVRVGTERPDFSPN